ncbi:MAG: hypothetical protein R3240_05155, partial [Gammaproteobacteria bacterium]|nr:hypothetical protein [Gammaproteobacteria bacterium]
NFDTGSKDQFRHKSLDYLNTEIAPLMTRLLSKAKDARYQQMPDREKETFLASIAKEESVPVAFIQKLMNSAYAFSLHLSNINGSISINQEKKKNMMGVPYMAYDTTLSLNTSVTLEIFHYDVNTSEFKPYNSIEKSSGSVSASEDFMHYPGKRAALHLFNSAFGKAIKASGIALNTKLKDDDNFAVYATIDQLKGNTFESRVGEVEDLRIDAPYRIYQYRDGKAKQMGWAKVRSVATEKTYKEKPAEYYSHFDLIDGDIEFKDQLREHPWTGFFWYIGVGSVNLNLESLDNESASGGGTYTGLNLGVTMDRGFMKNSAKDAEDWLTVDSDLAFIGGKDMKTGLGEFNSGLAAKLSIDSNHRYYPAAFGFYTEYKYGLGIAALLAGAKEGSDDLTVTGIGLNLGLKAGYNTSPDREYSLSIDYMYPFFARASLGKNNPEYEAKLSPAFSVSFQVAFHTRSIGGAASMMR